MEAPHRIWVEYGESGPEAMVWVGGSHIALRKLPGYILATPEALAKSPAVMALVKAAVEVERERCAEAYRKNCETFETGVDVALREVPK